MPDRGISDSSIHREFDVPRLNASRSPSECVYSVTQFNIIKKHILDFQASLDNEHDVGLLLTHFGQSVLMEVTQIGYEKSVLMIFKGFVNGRESTLIQHVSQLNFLLTSIPKSVEKPKNKIGFISNLA